MSVLGRATRPSVAGLVTLAGAIDADQRRPMEELRRRDHEIGTKLAGGRPERSAPRMRSRLLEWLSLVIEQQPELGQLAERTATARRAVDAAMCLLGILMGWLSTVAVFYYTGAGRVNIMAVLGVFVFLPLTLLVPLLLAALPSRAVRWLPGGPAIIGLARGLTPVRVLGLLRGLLPQSMRDALELATGRADAHQRLYADVQKWALIRWSQLLAASFSIAALLTVAALVVFSDLAFGWSTTLRIEPKSVHQLTQILSLPWAWALDAGRPELKLIQVSQYYRIEGNGGPNVDPARLGQWWPFLVLAMLTYGLIPRLITLGWAGAQLRWAVSRAFVHIPDSAAILSRLDAGLVQTRGEPGEPVAGAGQESGASKSTSTVADGHRPESSSSGESPPGRGITDELASISRLINWSAAPISDDALADMFSPAGQWNQVDHAGGAQTLAQDREVIEAVRLATGSHPTNQRPTARGVAIVVKAWEPPLMEMLDLLEDLRQSLGEGPPILVIAVNVDQAESLTNVRADHLDMWRRKISSLGDPWLKVVPLNPSELEPTNQTPSPSASSSDPSRGGHA